MPIEQPAPWSMVMPFVTVKSKGGPYDDDAYAAGYAAGLMDAQLAHVPDHLRTITEIVRTTDLEQIDLIAMRHGWAVHPGPDGDVDGWTQLRLTRPGGEDEH